jgi:uncharacterized membrane protein
MSFQEGGFGMYPVLVMGLVLLSAAGYYVVRPSRRVLAFVASIAVAVVLASLLGLTMGVSKTVRESVARPDYVRLIVAGAGHASNVILLGLYLLTPSALLVAIGGLRVNARG